MYIKKNSDNSLIYFSATGQKEKLNYRICVPKSALFTPQIQKKIYIILNLLEIKVDYQATITYLQNKKTEFHLFQLKDERAFRVVLKSKN